MKRVVKIKTAGRIIGKEMSRLFSWSFAPMQHFLKTTQDQMVDIRRITNEGNQVNAIYEIMTIVFAEKLKEAPTFWPGQKSVHPKRSPFKFVKMALSVAKTAPTPIANATHPHAVLRFTHFLPMIIKSWQRAMLAYIIALKFAIHTRDEKNIVLRMGEQKQCRSADG